MPQLNHIIDVIFLYLLYCLFFKPISVKTVTSFILGYKTIFKINAVKPLGSHKTWTTPALFQYHLEWLTPKRKKKFFTLLVYKPKLQMPNTWPDQSMVIDHWKSNRSITSNRWQLVNCYPLLLANRWPINNHNLESSNCHRLQAIPIDHWLLLTVICCQAICFRSIFNQLFSSTHGCVHV